MSRFRLGLLVGVAAGAIALWVSMRGWSAPAAQEWFFDLNTRQLFVADAQVAPIPAPSGDLAGAPLGTAAGVRAHVLSVDGRATHIAFLETYGPVARDLLTAQAEGQALPDDWLARLNADTYVALVPSEAAIHPTWVRASDPAAEAIVTAVERQLVAADQQVVTHQP